MSPSSRHSFERGLAARVRVIAGVAALVVGLLPAAPTGVLAAHTPDPTSVTIAGSLDSEVGCPGDWQPECAAAHLTWFADDDVWQGSLTPGAGNYEYKAALNGTWDENYGLHAVQGGPNIPLTATASAVKFYYDHKSHWVTDNVNSVIAVAPGSFQSELGCAGDWDPGCLRSWLQDPDGDGVYTFETTALPAGSYEGKVAIGESWNENYGQGGTPNGANIPFTVPTDNARVVFRYDAVSHVLSILAGHAHDNNVEWDGLRHDSRDTLYRTPGGAVEEDTQVTLRFRTFHDDVTGVSTRFFSVRLGGQRVVPMTRVAAGVPCYEAALAAETCDFWQLTIEPSIASQPDNLWYRFIITDGTDTDYYADDTLALDGGLGGTTDDLVDQSWALMQYVEGFSAPDWAKGAVIYQIFPDRFRNGRANNDPDTGDVRYADPVIELGWGTLPEGYCRNHATPDAACPYRFDPTATGREQPRGRDYMGGDLRGVDQKLDYLASLGVTAIYFNPIFDAGSNHSYDTQDYTKVDPYFGTQKDFDNLVKHADNVGIRIILDGVFNHMSSDSPLFDRYHHYATVGACESADSPYRDWFRFTDVAAGAGTCVGSTGTPNGARYESWFGFDSIPVLEKSIDEVKEYFVTSDDSITKRWLEAGASGWRLDVSGDSSFPNGYWESFRTEVKALDPEALTISETWQKDTTLLRMLRGDRLDTTMNYRFRDAVLGFLAPQAFDPKGFADSGQSIEPSVFLSRLASVREDYADASYYSLMNLLDSHDTERLLWTLTPGPETPANKEGNAASVAAGKARVRLASLIQFTVPGAPTVYYGDEVGMTGDDDPDDRRTYPWADLGGSPDTAMFGHYQALAGLRSEVEALT
ncbi:MAG TPA: alpha-amylase family glycosyl hydrolase, partial [Candidatus Limnocylindrales bacterium]|nr:alpha-amylase family glycosyl hydrolase [Candidatus Limnocylindrales bacterium]